MPTSYTSFIEDGKVRDAKSFLHLCLRAFGVCIKMGDTLELKDDYTLDIITGYQKDIDYHQKNLDDANRRLKEIQEMNDDELCAKYISDTTKKIQNLEILREKDINKYGDYLMIRENIEKWDCDYQFKEVKEFALRQIDCSINKSSYFDDELAKCGKPTKEEYEKTKNEYLESLIDPIKLNINYHSNEIERCVKAREKALEFYKKFKEELEKIPVH